MDLLIRECPSIAALNRIIDRLLDDETYQLVMDRLFELVLEAEIDDGNLEVDVTTSLNDTGDVNSENDAVDVSAENTVETDNMTASTSTGATSFVDAVIPWTTSMA